MAIGAGSVCVKLLIFIFNFIFVITGLVVFAVGIYVFATMNHYVEWLDIGLISSPVIFMIVGVVIFTVAFFGCCGAIKENYCMIITFSVLLLVMLVVEMGVGVASYVKHDDLEQHLGQRLNDSLMQFNTNTNVKKTFDILQTELKCCGVNGPNDWSDNIPESCCASGLTLVGGVPEACTAHTEQLHRRGCYPKLLSLINSNAFIVGSIGLAIAVVQFLGVLFACCLACSIKKDYQTV